MCFDDDSRPPIPVVENSGAHGEETHLTASDGTRVLAFRADPPGTPRSQVVILPDVRGLHTFYRELAMRFAENGVRALAIDYFGRTTESDVRDESFEFRTHVEKMTPETFELDLRAGVEALREGEGHSVPIFSLGFCMGGALSFWAGTRGLGLAGVIGFYAALSRHMGAVTPVLDFAARIESPVLGLFGGADQAIPVDEVERFKQELAGAGIEHEVIVYPGAPHSFFDRKAAEFAVASADAWNQVQRFVEGHAAVRV